MSSMGVHFGLYLHDKWSLIGWYFSAPIGSNSEVSSSDSCHHCQDDLDCRDHSDVKRESPATETGKPYLKFSVSAILSKCQQQQQQGQVNLYYTTVTSKVFFNWTNSKLGQHWTVRYSILTRRATRRRTCLVLRCTSLTLLNKDATHPLTLIQSDLPAQNI